MAFARVECVAVEDEEEYACVVDEKLEGGMVTGGSIGINGIVSGGCANPWCC